MVLIGVFLLTIYFGILFDMFNMFDGDNSANSAIEQIDNVGDNNNIGDEFINEVIKINNFAGAVDSYWPSANSNERSAVEAEVSFNSVFMTWVKRNRGLYYKEGNTLIYSTPDGELTYKEFY